MAWYDVLNLRRRAPIPESNIHIGGDQISKPDILTEKGASGTDVEQNNVKSPEYNIDWQGASGVANAEKMRKSDASVRSVLQAVKLPLLRATWSIVPGTEQADDKDKKYAEICHRYLVMSEKRHESWTDVLNHFLTCLDFGFSVSEKVWDLSDEGILYPRRLAARLAPTITDFTVGPNGILKSISQDAIRDGKNVKLTIPSRYAFVLSYEKEGDNYWGVPLLRYLWMHYFYKTELYRIDSVRLDRFGIGIPIAEIEKGYTLKRTEKNEIIELLKGLRSHHRAYAMVPQEVKIRIMTPENERGGASGLMEAVDHHDVMMARAVLAHFLTAGSQKHGNYGTTVAWADMFLYGLQALAQFICDEFRRQVIYEFCDLNFDMARRSGKPRPYPKLVASTLEDTNVKELAAALYNLVLGQVVTPDDDLERHIRKLYGFPSLQAGFSREERGTLEQPVPSSPALAAPNVITGEPSRDDKESMPEPTPGTKPGTTPPPRGPIRAPGDRG